MVASRVPLPVDDLDVLRRRRSAKWAMYPDDVLPLPVAEMDFPLAPAVREVLAEAVAASDTGYAFPGVQLGAALAGFAAGRWGWHLDPDRTRAAADVSVGCVDMLRVMCDPGDAVVITPPVYPPFYRWVEEVGARLVEAPLSQDSRGEWQLDLSSLEAAFAQRPKAFVLCNPHNPVGRVHTRDELVEVVRLAHDYGVWIVGDEVHAPLVLPGAEFTPLLTIPGAAEIAVSLVSASKAWNLAGLKCAQIVTASAQMQALVDRRPPDAVWRPGHFGVLASIAAYEGGVEWLDALVSTLDGHRSLLDRLLGEHLPGVRWMPPQATYLAWLDCREIGDGAAPCTLFLDRARVALDPGPDFGPPGSGWVRLNFATSEHILTEAVTRMGAAVGR